MTAITALALALSIAVVLSFLGGILDATIVDPGCEFLAKKIERQWALLLQEGRGHFSKQMNLWRGLILRGVERLSLEGPSLVDVAREGVKALSEEDLFSTAREVSTRVETFLVAEKGDLTILYPLEEVELATTILAKRAPRQIFRKGGSFMGPQ